VIRLKRTRVSRWKVYLDGDRVAYFSIMHYDAGHEDRYEVASRGCPELCHLMIYGSPEDAFADAVDDLVKHYGVAPLRKIRRVA
jgi:hypothetical protein